MSTNSNDPANDDNVVDAGNQGQPQAGDDGPGHRDQGAAKTKTVRIYLPYSQQGDDLAECLEDTGNLSDALEAHADLMDLAAEMLRRNKEEVAGHEVSIETDGHRILMTGPAEVIDDLSGGADSDLDEDVDEVTERAEFKSAMSHFIDREVAAGFLPQDQIAGSAADGFSGGFPFPILLPIAERLAKIAIKKHQKEQATWPAVTDCDRLDRAFAELEQHGIMCGQNCHVGFKQELTWACLGAREIRGYCCYYEQDTDVVLKQGLLSLDFGVGPAAKAILDAVKEGPNPNRGIPAVMEAMNTTGHEIVETLRVTGWALSGTLCSATASRSTWTGSGGRPPTSRQNSEPREDREAGNFG